MENTEKLAMMKAKYIELGKKLGLNDELLTSIEKELKEKETPEAEKKETPEMEKTEETPKIEEKQEESTETPTCGGESPVMIMVKKHKY